MSLSRPVSVVYVMTFLTACCLGLSCQRVSDEPGDDELVTYLLNNQQYESAVALLLNKVKQDPDNARYRVLLSSAYAGEAGISTISCFEALKPKLFDEPQAPPSESSLADLKPGSQALSGDSDDPDKRMLEAEKELLKFTNQATDFLSIAVKIPQVPRGKRFLLAKALGSLEAISDSSDQYVVGTLYSAILHLVQFLSYTRDALPRYEEELKENSGRLGLVYCGLDVRVFLRNASTASGHLKQAFLNLNEAQRTSKNPTYKNLQIVDGTLTTVIGLLEDNSDLAEVLASIHDSHKAQYCR